MRASKLDRYVLVITCIGSRSAVRFYTLEKLCLFKRARLSLSKTTICIICKPRAPRVFLRVQGSLVVIVVVVVEEEPREACMQVGRKLEMTC